MENDAKARAQTVVDIARRLGEIEKKTPTSQLETARAFENKIFESSKNQEDYRRRIEKRLAKVAALVAAAEPPAKIVRTEPPPTPVQQELPPFRGFQQKRKLEPSKPRSDAERQPQSHPTEAVHDQQQKRPKQEVTVKSESVHLQQSSPQPKPAVATMPVLPPQRRIPAATHVQQPQPRAPPVVATEQSQQRKRPAPPPPNHVQPEQKKIQPAHAQVPGPQPQRHTPPAAAEPQNGEGQQRIVAAAPVALSVEKKLPEKKVVPAAPRAEEKVAEQSRPPKKEDEAVAAKKRITDLLEKNRDILEWYMEKCERELIPKISYWEKSSVEPPELTVEKVRGQIAAAKKILLMLATSRLQQGDLEKISVWCGEMRRRKSLLEAYVSRSTEDGRLLDGEEPRYEHLIDEGSMLAALPLSRFEKVQEDEYIGELPRDSLRFRISFREKRVALVSLEEEIEGKEWPASRFELWKKASENATAVLEGISSESRMPSIAKVLRSSARYVDDEVKRLVIDTTQIAPKAEEEKCIIDVWESASPQLKRILTFLDEKESSRK